MNFFEFSQKIRLNIKFYFSNPRRHFLAQNHVIWRIKHKSVRWRVGGRQLEEPKQKKTKKNVVNMRTSEGVYFAYMGRRNPSTDRLQILFGYRDPGRNHVYQIWWRSVKGFLFGGVPKFALSHWLWSSSLQQCYATACTVIPMRMVESESHNVRTSSVPSV